MQIKERQLISLDIISVSRYNNIMLKELIQEKNMSIYKVCKVSNIPYSTLLDLVNSKTSMLNCSVKTVLGIANALNVTVDEIIRNCVEHRLSFQEFRNEMCHMLKEKGDLEFIEYIYNSSLVENYYNKHYYEEMLYTLAMLDFVSKENNIPIAREYNKYRVKKLNKKIYPRDYCIIKKLNENDDLTKKVEKNWIKEFKKYNIMECNIRDAV